MSVSVHGSVCLSLRMYSSETSGPNFTKFYVHIACRRGSVLHWRRSDMLRVSGFVDKAIFSYHRSKRIWV